MSSKLGIVIIGRNEGDRLRRCLESVDASEAQIVYVDSASTDDSCALARSMGASVVDLDMSKPFNAARARNAGFERLGEVRPEFEYVHFVDGDCELAEGWLERAVEVMESEERLAAVCGLLNERNPEASVYNRLCDLEWPRRIGEIKACGGIFLARREAFEDVGGFDATVAAGEEPELCQRLRANAWKIRRVDSLMCLHDSAIMTFKQWWSRQIRTGYGALDVATRFGAGPDQLFVDTVRSARVWGIALPAAIASGGMVGAIAGGPAAAGTLTALGLSVLPLQSLRIAARANRGGHPLALSLTYGALTVISKFAHVIGQYRHVTAKGTALGAHKARAPLQQAADSTGNAQAADDEADPAVAQPIRAREDAAWQADKARYPEKPWLREQSIWAVAVYRFGKRVDNRKPGLKRRLLDRAYWLLYRLTETLTGIGIPKEVEIGPGFRIHHFGGIFVHNHTKIGANVTLRQGCTLGNRHEGGPAPVLEDGVELGAYAQVLGGVTLGRGAKVGAMAVVLCDVPAGATAVGQPAKIVSPKSSASSVAQVTTTGPSKEAGATTETGAFEAPPPNTN